MLNKEKYSLSSKFNNKSTILSKEGKEKTYKRPKSSTRIPRSHHRISHNRLHNQDYFSIVLNSLNTENYDSLITLKNWNKRKLNFFVK